MATAAVGSRVVAKAKCAARPSARAAPAAKPRGPAALRAVELDSDTITLGLAALAGVGVGIGFPVLFTLAEKRDRERIEEIRELNRATLKATGATLSEVRRARARSRRRGARQNLRFKAGARAWRARAPRAQRPGRRRSRHSFLWLAPLLDEIAEMRPNRYLDRRCVACRRNAAAEAWRKTSWPRVFVGSCRVAWRRLTRPRSPPPRLIPAPPLRSEFEDD